MPAEKVRDAGLDSLVLDIGGDVGALIVYATVDCVGLEIDLTPSGTSRSHRVHTDIRLRQTTHGGVAAGVFPDVAAGTYTVWGLDSDPLGTAAITGGTVTTFEAADCRAKESDPYLDGRRDR